MSFQVLRTMCINTQVITPNPDPNFEIKSRPSRKKDPDPVLVSAPGLFLRVGFGLFFRSDPVLVYFADGTGSGFFVEDRIRIRFNFIRIPNPLL